MLMHLELEKQHPLLSTNLEKHEIDERNLGQDLPYIISLTPSVSYNI